MLLSIGRGTEPAVLVSGNSRPADAVPGLIGRRGLNFPRGLDIALSSSEGGLDHRLHDQAALTGR
jgi:hypothetical protein